MTYLDLSGLAELCRASRSLRMVEQNAFMTLQVGHRGCALETGTIALEGTVAQLREKRKVKEAYLGG